MDFFLPIEIKKLPDPIAYTDPVMLVGSCFSEHMGGLLQEVKFDVLQNPNGILFDPSSVARSLVSYVQNQQYHASDLVYFNELFHSWQHHSIFSGTDQVQVLERINQSQAKAHEFLKRCTWLVITLGSSFCYKLTGPAQASARTPMGAAVANCHRAPAQWFRKQLLSIEEINAELDNSLHQLFAMNPAVQVLFTVSPVRHVRDGVIQNNRSKARLIEVVHHLAAKFERIHYFPAYELVIDVLRDYRFYDLDLVHPNYQATDYVLDQFAIHCIGEPSRRLMEEIKKIVLARKHKAFQPNTKAHRQFLQEYLEKTRLLQARYPTINFQEELSYFSLPFVQGAP
jgi:GSCFA family